MNPIFRLSIPFILSLFVLQSSVGCNKANKALKTMGKVADWQLDNPSEKETWAWEYGTFYTGLMAFYELKPHEKYLDNMLQMGESNDWELKPHPYLADNFTIAQTYIKLYMIEEQDRMIDKTQYVMDMAFYRRPKKINLKWVDNPHRLNWWSWCDALFMAPPAFALMSEASGDSKYIDEMNRLWKYTYKYLYDRDEDLFYRDDSYFDAKTKQEKKVFWSRGNGWVMGGLVRVLESMPQDYKDRAFYEGIFKQMSASLLKLQSEEGYWYSSLLDKEEFKTKETSGTAFFCYAYAWGINNGLLKREQYEEATFLAWKTLCDAVQKDGKLGYVQRVGVGPDQVSEDDTELYGTGAFLLAGSEVYKLLNQKYDKDSIN